MFLKECFLVFLLFQVQNTKAAWHVPFFKDTQTNGVILQQAVGVQKINVREELKLPFKLAKINYDGVGIPTFGSFDIGDNSLLGAKITFTNNEWLIFIEKRQDYENPQQRIYLFQIYIKGDESILKEEGILLTLENVFDNNPSITYSPSPCKVEELHSDYLTNCTFSVYDPDGMDRNNIRIDVGGQNTEKALFQFIEFGNTTTYQKNFKLRIKRELHYEERAIYNLEVRVYDANNNTGIIFAILEVIDLPNRDPLWVRPLTTASFDEKQEQYFALKAIDGDTGINKPICYRLEFENDYSHLMSINESTGVLHVLPIDRDTLNQQIFSFYTCAYKCDNASWAIKNNTILIVQDINDHIPEITLVPETVSILEAKYLTLPLEQFIISDMDLGNNATYDVSITSFGGNIEFAKAFSLIPTAGYQETNFSLSVALAESLDYEDEDWRHFQITILAQEVENAAHSAKRSLQIELINWNDEWPIFTKDNYEISILENTTAGTFLQQVYATDRDINDAVIHSIVGNITGLHINQTTGVIITNMNNLFDYERQTVLLLQIQAKDTLQTTYSNVLHTTFAQLVINIVDVNDETPELRMPRSIVNITENALPFTILTNKIEAHDADSTANLTFEIVWSESYATKGGQAAANEHFVDCFIIEPKFESPNLVYAFLRINPLFNKMVDYEKYDSIFLAIKVRDVNQEINDDSITAMLTIRIDDVNDNAPEFKLGTLQEPRKVTEMEDDNTVLGTIEAFDIDGAGNNVITFGIRPFGNLTQPDLVAINNVTGVLRVNSSIRCDIPKLYFLEYDIILTDTVHTTEGKINISIIDVNNRIPVIDAFPHQVEIYENATTGYIVGQIKAHDDDRDAPHNLLEYSINSALALTHNLFQVNITTGLVTVNLRNGATLDCDNGVTYQYLAVDIKDNFNFNNPGYGPVNHRSTFINITLLDVNDNAPIMPAVNLFAPEFSEADLKDTIGKIRLKAMDNDEPNTPNSRISYKIMSIAPARENAPIINNYDNIFSIVSDNQSYGSIIAKKNLKGFYGYWQIEIEAHDHGEPRLSNSSLYELYVRPHNFHAPAIIYPLTNKSIRVCYALQEVSRPLYAADCVTRLSMFEAYDLDGGEYGDINFKLSSDVGADKYFKIVKENRYQASIQLKELVPSGIYYLNLRATDGGGRASVEIHNLKIVFVDMLGNPMFMQPTYQTNFTENEEGLLEERYIAVAYDPKNEGLSAEDEQYKLYYFIDETINSSAAKRFTLDKETRLLKLTAMLDREAEDLYEIRVKVTNNENGLITNPNSINYTLDVKIKVNDVNDNAPNFTQIFYAAGITLKDALGKNILRFHADDPDLDDAIDYKINQTSLMAYGENIAASKNDLFILNNRTGELSLNAYILANMKGYFRFSIMAKDSALPPHTDNALVKIYIVSEANRVKFVFLSDIQAIRDHEQFIREQFEAIYGYEICNIDAIDDVTNQQSPQQRLESNEGAYITELIVHFINNNEAVEAREIQRRSTDLAFVSKLQNILQRHNLILNDVPHLTSEDVSLILDDWLLTALIAVSVLLAVTCAILVLVFVLKIRALKRQLKAFEPPEFSSVASNLNRIGVPSGNIFSVEGSNPIINNQNRTLQRFDIFDDQTSSESDEECEFDGLHDDPIFDMNSKSTQQQDKQQDTFDQKILNNDYFVNEKNSNYAEGKIRF